MLCPHLLFFSCTGAETGHREDNYVGPVKRIVSPLVKLLIISNKKVINGVAEGESCQAFYPIQCDAAEGRPTYDTCPQTGLITCDKTTNKCPISFQPDATLARDQVVGVVFFLLALVLLFLSMSCFTHVMQKLLHGMSKNVVHTATSCNGYIGIICGIGLTMIVQSSSTVTSVLVPLVATEALRLETAYPIIVGANIGTAIGAVVSSMDSIGTDPLQVALAHLFFNLTGALIWYPLYVLCRVLLCCNALFPKRALFSLFAAAAFSYIRPPLRNVIMHCTRRLARGVDLWRWNAFIYLIGVFFLVPTFFLGLSNLYTNQSTASLVIAILLTLAVGGGLIWLTYWCKVQGGDVKYVRFIKALKKRTSRRHNKRNAAQSDNNNAALLDNGKQQEAQNGGLLTTTHPTVGSLATLPHPSLEEKRQLHAQQLTTPGTSPAWFSVTTHKDQQGSEVLRLEL
jgi:solute carrier family 34 (sodium-dependent phosphate cotransporter)